ncbi:hypothetical protein [Calidithermus chliarophilus]|uniref:hypothetical protein n=1 Tax=Calidithermus chliarophilus TaxID=52023 RepID=UPI0004258AEC|nr:hypothetical protein [Calidithermus chliarophilus]
MKRWNLVQGDALEVLRTLPDAHFHAMLSDPPYGLRFMGRRWDAALPDPEVWAELYRVLMPGAFLMAFSSSRTWHRLACHIEDAGFIMHPTLFGWANGEGFPKATRVDTAVDRRGGNPQAWRAFATAYAAAVETSPYTHSEIDRFLGIKSSSCYWARTDQRGGLPPRRHWERVRDLLGLNGSLEALYAEAEREVVGQVEASVPTYFTDSIGQGSGQARRDITAPATDLARDWAGHRYGLQALKPAVEPILVLQKPYEGKPVEDITSSGAGALNIEGARVGTGSTRRVGYAELGYGGRNKPGAYESGSAHGRWPANLILLDGAAAAALDAQSGVLKSGSRRAGVYRGLGYAGSERAEFPEVEGDEGGASRFFFVVQEQIDGADPIYYCAKASRSERDAGLEAPNPHPTVKPIRLAHYLATLLLPPARYAPRRLLNLYSGSGSEAIGAVLAGWEEVTGVEREPENIAVAEARLRYWSERGLEAKPGSRSRPGPKPNPNPEPRPAAQGAGLFDFDFAQEEA